MPSLSETALAAPFCARRSALSRSYLLSSVSSSCLQVGQLLWLDSQGAKHAEWKAWLHGISCTRSASSKSSLCSIAKTSELVALKRQQAQWTCSPDMGKALRDRGALTHAALKRGAHRRLLILEGLELLDGILCSRRLHSWPIIVVHQGSQHSLVQSCCASVQP